MIKLPNVTRIILIKDLAIDIKIKFKNNLNNIV